MVTPDLSCRRGQYDTLMIYLPKGPLCLEGGSAFTASAHLRDFLGGPEKAPNCRLSSIKSFSQRSFYQDWRRFDSLDGLAFSVVSFPCASHMS